MTKPPASTAPDTPNPFATPEALKRLKKRHAAERRFKLYGQLAIGIAMSALVVLAWSIISRAVPAFTKHVVVFELTLDPATVAPNGTADTATIAGNVSGFYSLVQQDLRQTFPQVEGDRAQSRELYDLVTRLAILDTARKVARHPNMVGTRQRITAPLSDNLDLYLKGGITTRHTFETGTARAITPLEDGTYAVSATLDDGFAALATADPDAASTLIHIGPTWYSLLASTERTLTLRHLAGPLPDSLDLVDAPVAALKLTEAAGNRAVSDRQIAWTLLLKQEGRIKRIFNLDLLTKADSTYPEIAGAAAAIVGSIFTMLITAFFAIPVGILAAVYLEEFAPKNRLTNLIEVNINNLAAVPSIIFGLLGAAVFLNFFGMPRSVPLVGGLVLGLLVLPTVIIASRAALKSVPPSIRTAALGLGASKTQAVFHHTLPLAAPGILTGTIIAMARALGETAPLLLIGMVAFVNEIPTGPNQESTVLPVLIFKWFSGAERAWEPMTSAVILILLVFLIVMNLTAVLLRRQFERRW